VEQNQRRNSLASHSKGIEKGIKRVYVHDFRKDQTYGGNQDAPTNDIKRFKHTKPTKTTVRIRIKNLKNIKTFVEHCTGSATLGCSRTELDNNPQRNHPLNMVAKKRLKTHDRELLAYHSVLKAFHAQGYLSWERNDLLTNLRKELHITNDEYTDELKLLVVEP